MRRAASSVLVRALRRLRSEAPWGQLAPGAAQVQFPLVDPSPMRASAWQRGRGLVPPCVHWFLSLRRNL